MAAFLARREHVARVASTNDVVRGWLAGGTAEVALAVADEQTAGRGRDGRTWTAPPGSALLLSLGFRPTWLEPERVWRLAATVSLAMAEAAEAATGLAPASIRLKWPNDLVVEDDVGIRKLAGVLGESDGLGTDDPRAVIGIGVNGAWPASAFPSELSATMTSLQAIAADRHVDHEIVLEAFLERLEAGVDALRHGRFGRDAWAARQVTTDRDIDLIDPAGAGTTVRAVGVDPDTGALEVHDPTAAHGRRSIVVGEIRHVRLAARSRDAAPAVM